MNSALGIVIGLAVLSCIFWILGAGVCRLMGRKEEPGFLWLFGMALFLGIFSVVDIFTEAGGAAFHVLFYTALAVLVIAVALGVVYLVRAGRKEADPGCGIPRAMCGCCYFSCCWWFRSGMGWETSCM